MLRCFSRAVATPPASFFANSARIKVNVPAPATAAANITTPGPGNWTSDSCAFGTTLAGACFVSSAAALGLKYRLLGFVRHKSYSFAGGPPTRVRRSIADRHRPPRELEHLGGQGAASWYSASSSATAWRVSMIMENGAAGIGMHPNGRSPPYGGKDGILDSSADLTRGRLELKLVNSIT